MLRKQPSSRLILQEENARNMRNLSLDEDEMRPRDLMVRLTREMNEKIAANFAAKKRSSSD